MNVRHLAAMIIVAMFPILSSCTPSSEADSASLEGLSDENENTYKITNQQFSSSGMKLAPLASNEFYEVVKTYGMFDVPPQNRSSISAYFGGYVKEIRLLPGQRVEKGQTLFTMENPEYVQMQQDFLEAKGQLSYLKSDFERQKNLVEDNITSQKNFLKAEADYTVTKVRYESLKIKLGLMNINTDNLDVNNMRTVINVTAPISGYVTSVNVSKGMYLNPSDVAIMIIDTEHQHLELTIFEKDLSVVTEGQPIKFRIQDTDQVYDAEVHLVNRSIDPEKRTVSVHGHLIDEKNTRKFSPGMYIEADIYTSSYSRMALPSDAIVNIEDKYFVLIKKSSSADLMIFEKRQVVVGASSGGFTEIQNHQDFEEGTEFMTRGAFNLITE